MAVVIEYSPRIAVPPRARLETAITGAAARAGASASLILAVETLDGWLRRPRWNAEMVRRLGWAIHHEIARSSGSYELITTYEAFLDSQGWTLDSDDLRHSLAAGALEHLELGRYIASGHRECAIIHMQRHVSAGIARVTEANKCRKYH